MANQLVEDLFPSEEEQLSGGEFGIPVVPVLTIITKVPLLAQPKIPFFGGGVIIADPTI